jgi:hypothetical protein
MRLFIAFLTILGMLPTLVRWTAQGSISRRVRCDAEGFFDRGRIVNLSALDHGGNVAGVANVLRGVAIDEDHVGQFSSGDDAEVFRYAHHLSPVQPLRPPFSPAGHPLQKLSRGRNNAS